MRIPRIVLGLGAAGAGFIAARQFWNKSEPYSFHRQVVLITGGSRGLGLVIARQLADEGARLALVARDEAELDRARNDLAGQGAEVVTFVCDVSDREQAAQAVERTVAHYARIDVLINNAGVIQAGPVEHMQQNDFEEAINIHVWGPLVTMLTAFPHMRRQGGGRVVNIASIGGKVAVPHLVPYTTSKFGLVGLSDGMRAEVAKDNILVTTVSPGLMRTGSHINALFKGQHSKEFTWFSIMNALPVTSISAEQSASQIIEACRSGQPELVVSIQAKIATTVASLFPNTTGQILKLVSRTLPGPTTGQEGDHRQSGSESQSALAPSLLTQLSDTVSAKNNELKR